MRWFLLSVLCFTSFLLGAQALEIQRPPVDSIKKRPVFQNKVKYKSIVISAPYRKVRDEGQSPLTHRGPSLQLGVYNERWRAKSTTKLEFVLGIGLLQTNKHKINYYTRAPALNMEVNYHYLRPVCKLFKGKGNWYAGAILTNTFDGRLYSFLPNNSFGYEFSNAFNPASNVTYQFKLGNSKRAYEVGYKISMALLSHVVRPNFIGMEPAETYSDEKIKPFEIFTHGNKIVLPNRFFRINSEIYIDRFKLTNQDKIRFFYGWSLHATRLTQSNPLYSASHTIGIISMIYSEKVKKPKHVNR